ncbi:MAG TPA: hypothetical protein VFX78_12980 [Candidatus Eisenbacteria bacterium]|nr:hypothetical protein [Candidatus Eisenbacteria bacterium]
MFRHDALASGRYRRVPSRWETDFGRWISDVGIPRIVATLARDPDLRITNQTVYEWLQGHPPHPSRAMALVEMSDGRLSLEAIYRHGQEVRDPAGHAPETDRREHAQR